MSAPIPGNAGGGWHQRWWYLSILFVFVAIGAVGPWWRSWPDALSDGYRETTQNRLTAWSRTRSDTIPVGPLRAGAAKCDIGEVAGARALAGYGKRAFRSNDGSADPIYARVLVVDNGHRRVALVTADLLLFNRVLAAAVVDGLRRHEPNWRREDIYFGATHTHSAPGGFAGCFAEEVALGRFDASWTRELAERIADTIRVAADRMKPAELTTGAIEVDSSLARNRTVAEGPVNKWLDWVHIRTQTRDALATVVVFGAHATCRPTSDCRISGDYPGVLQREVERSLGGECLFFAGAVGSMGPPDALCPREQLAEELGGRLAVATVHAVRASDSFAEAVAVEPAGLFATLPTPRVKLGQYLVLSPVLAGLLLENDAWIGAVRLGDLVLVGAPADYSGVLAEALRTVTPGARTVVTSFSGDYVGYLLPADYYDLPKYEPRTMSLFGPGAGEEFQGWLAQIAGQLGRPAARERTSAGATDHQAHSRR